MRTAVSRSRHRVVACAVALVFSGVRVGAGDDTANAPPPSVILKEQLEKFAAVQRQVEASVAGGDFARARAVYRDYADFWSNSQGSNHWTTVVCLRFIESFDRILRLDERGRTSAREAFAKWEQAKRLVMANRFAEAEALERHAAESFEQLLGVNDVHTVETQSLYAVILGKLNKYGMALPVQERALSACEKLYGNRSPVYAKILHNFAVINGGLGNNDDLTTQMLKVAEIRSLIFGMYSKEHLDIWIDLANHLDHKDDLQHLEIVCRKAIEITHRDRINKRTFGYHVQFLSWLAMAMRKQERHAEAVEVFREAAPSLERIRQCPPNVLADVYSQFADSLRKVGQMQEATTAEGRAAHFLREAERASEFPLKSP